MNSNPMYDTLYDLYWGNPQRIDEAGLQRATQSPLFWITEEEMKLILKGKKEA